MNCKLGDMAIIMKSMQGNEGKIVTCMEYAGMVSWSLKDEYIELPTWKIDIPLKQRHPHLRYLIPDVQLRPIRPSDEQDEMLRIVGLPNKEKEKA